MNKFEDRLIEVGKKRSKFIANSVVVGYHGGIWKHPKIYLHIPRCVREKMELKKQVDVLVTVESIEYV